MGLIRFLLAPIIGLLHLVVRLVIAILRAIVWIIGMLLKAWILSTVSNELRDLFVAV